MHLFTFEAAAYEGNLECAMILLRTVMTPLKVSRWMEMGLNKNGGSSSFLWPVGQCLKYILNIGR